MSSYEFFEKMGIRVWRNGHGHTGVHHSIHSDYSAIPGYFDKMVAAYGEQRAKAILDENRHNTSYFPNFTVKGPIQAIRLFKPVAPNRTLAESWTFRLVDAPDQLLERTLIYSRLINAPTSIVGHDDLEMYERAQEGLHVDANPWVNIQRLYDPAEAEQETAVINGTSEWQMRNQFRAWSKFMTHVDVAGANVMDAPTDQDLIGFVVHEARLIDQHRFEEWLDLFADDGYYWMPLEWGQTDPRLTTSLMYEDKLLLRIRVERLKGNRTFSQKPKSRCHHVLAGAAGRPARRSRQRICHLDADALCRDPARRAGPLRRLGDPYAGRDRRQAEDQTKARRSGQLRRRVAQHSAFHVRPK